MTDQRRPPETRLVTAHDGLAAREVGPWSEEKLFYVSRYMDIFSNGMKNRWRRRAYIDLFAGPGRCVIEGTNNEIDGSPLLARNPKYSFTDFYFNDADPVAIDALGKRVGQAPGLTIETLDCNNAARRVSSVLGFDSNTISLAFIDPTAFQISFDAVADMTRGRPIDLIITLMTGYLKRFIDQPSYAPGLDSFFGSPDWRDFLDLRAAGERLTFRALLDYYEDKLRKIEYRHVVDDVRILNKREATIYHLVFASKSERGADFFEKISRRRFRGQQRLF